MKILLNPLNVSAFIVTLLLGSLAHLMYGSCQTTKYHYMTQCYWMPKYFPKNIVKNKIINNPLFGKAISPEEAYSGLWIHWSSKGIVICEYNLINGHLAGLFNTYSENGKLISTGGYSIDGLGTPVGEWVTYYENGNVSSTITLSQKGERDGLFQEWYDDGSLESKVNYVNGTIVGEWHYFNKDGTLNNKEYYNNKGNFQKRERIESGEVVRVETTY